MSDIGKNEVKQVEQAGVLVDAFPTVDAGAGTTAQREGARAKAVHNVSPPPRSPNHQITSVAGRHQERLWMRG